MKSRETCLTNCTQPISHHITPLVINTPGAGHTDTHTDARTKVISRNQPSAVCTWFKNNTVYKQACHMMCTKSIKAQTCVDKLPKRHAMISILNKQV